MSCNGCRVLRKGCSDNCILRPCLQWIESSEPQANATVFVAKFFGRAGLMTFISAVPPSQRPALFQSLLFEAAGRTVNPVTGAVGLFRTGNWHVCQEAVETVLRGGTLRPIQQLLEGSTDNEIGSDFPAEVSDNPTQLIPGLTGSVARSNIQKRRRSSFGDLELNLSTGFPMNGGNCLEEDRRRWQPECSGRNSEESITTTNNGFEEDQNEKARNLLNLFN